MGAVCTDGVCHKCWAGKFIVIGVLILVWNWYLTGNFLGKDWPTFIGLLVILKGILKMVKPQCPHCEVKPVVKKKK